MNLLIVIRNLLNYADFSVDLANQTLVIEVKYYDADI